MQKHETIDILRKRKMAEVEKARKNKNIPKMIRILNSIRKDVVESEKQNEK